MARVKHFDEQWRAYHLTTRTLGGQFQLAKPVEKQTIVNALAFYQQRGDFTLYGYVIMDNHVHLVIQPSMDRALSEIACDFKKWTSRRNKLKPQGRLLWERRYDDNLIHDHKEMITVLEYIHANPVRAGMVSRPELYPWSSARDYAGQTDIMLPVTKKW